MQLSKALFVLLLSLAALAPKRAAAEVPGCALDVYNCITLSAGTYNFCYISVHAQGSLYISEKVVIFVEQTLLAEPGSLISGQGLALNGPLAARDAAAPCGGRGSALKFGGGGGGHGGRGGDGSGSLGSGGGACDNPANPGLVGGGGGGAYGAPGGAGGACLLIYAPSSRLLGDIDFSGAPGTMGAAGSGGGAGGTFYLYGGTLEFTGLISVAGAKGGGPPLGGPAVLARGGGGGGGLVCIDTAQPVQGQGSVNVAGGPGAGAGQAVFRLHQYAPSTLSPTPASGESAPAGQAFLDRNVMRPGQGALRLRFSPSAAGRVRVKVFDLQGRAVAALFDAAVNPGAWQEAAWDPLGAGAAPVPGLYVVSVQGAGLNELLKVILLR